MTRSWSASWRWTLAAALVAVLAGPPAAASAQAPPCTPGAPGVGDTYYPIYGNGGYDVRRYDLDVAYDPATDVLEGKATIRARAQQSLCSFNLDFVGMEVHSVRVNDRRATWSRSGQEFTIRRAARSRTAGASRSSSATPGYRRRSSSRGATCGPGSWPRRTART